MSELTQERLRELLDYDPETGVFRWRVAKAGNVKAGMIAGSPNCKGYRQISIDNTLITSHRLAFLYMTGAFPSGCVDHINRVKDDNSWRNLREVSLSDNQKNANRRRNAKNRVLGVSRRSDNNKFFAYIGHNGRRLSLGVFEDFFEAVCARKSAEIKYDYHPNHGRAAA